MKVGATCAMAHLNAKSSTGDVGVVLGSFTIWRHASKAAATFRTVTCDDCGFEIKAWCAFAIDVDKSVIEARS